MTKIPIKQLIVFSTLIFANLAHAEAEYYNDVVPAGRATGMGGAFAGIADDPSGIYYNPGGLVSGNEVSVTDSTTYFYNKDLVAKDVFGSQNLVVHKSALATFLGMKKHLTPDIV